MCPSLLKCVKLELIINRSSIRFSMFEVGDIIRTIVRIFFWGGDTSKLLNSKIAIVVRSIQKHKTRPLYRPRPPFLRTIAAILEKVVLKMVQCYRWWASATFAARLVQSISKLNNYQLESCFHNIHAEIPVGICHAADELHDGISLHVVEAVRAPWTFHLVHLWWGKYKY